MPFSSVGVTVIARGAALALDGDKWEKFLRDFRTEAALSSPSPSGLPPPAAIALTWSVEGDGNRVNIQISLSIAALEMNARTNDSIINLHRDGQDSPPPSRNVSLTLSENLSCRAFISLEESDLGHDEHVLHDLSAKSICGNSALAPRYIWIRGGHEFFRFCGRCRCRNGVCFLCPPLSSIQFRFH